MAVQLQGLCFLEERTECCYNGEIEPIMVNRTQVILGNCWNNKRVAKGELSPYEFTYKEN